VGDNKCSAHGFSFVIPALNEEAVLEPCVQSIRSQGGDDIEVIVVDNGSTDRTVEIAGRRGCTVVHEATRGLSHARNRGAEAAHGDVVCFIDADGVLSDDWLRAARACFSDPGVGAASGLSVYTHPNVLKRVWYNTYVIATDMGVLFSSLLFGRMVFAGNNLAIRRELFLRIGGYEDVIGEGMWLSRRFWGSGYRGKLCRGMLLWNSSRGFDEMGYVRTVAYWVRSSFERRTQAGYSYRSR
jgi:glycosyltransferase involved in cell wall biosynthesis